VHRGTRPKGTPNTNPQVPYNQELAGLSSEVLSRLTASTWQIKNEIEHIVERVVSQVLQGISRSCVRNWVRRVLRGTATGAERHGCTRTPQARPADLMRGISAIHAGTPQKEFCVHCSTASRTIAAGLLCSCSGGTSRLAGPRVRDNDQSKRLFDVLSGLPKSGPGKSGITNIDDPPLRGHFGSPAAEQGSHL